jgi:peptidoglycan/LPS O-acetylase OafA/YrhL
VLLGGGEILLSERANISVVLHAGAESLAGYLLPAVIAVCGLLLIFNPMHRTFYSVIAVLCSLGSWVTSNLGGFIVGMLLGLVGGSLAFGWMPDQEPRRRRRRRAGAAGASEAS